MIIAAFATAVAAAALIAFRDWRRGWYALLVIGVLQDPARKLTPGTPVVMTFTVIILYAAVLLSGRTALMEHVREFSRRFPSVYSAGGAVLFFVGLGALNGIATYGFEAWKVPALGLFTYLLPLPAVVIGYAFTDREERLYAFIRFYSFVTSIALVGTILEYFRVPSAALGLVAANQRDVLRHISGLSLRMLAGFYRAPDVMAWHAATLSAIGFLMAMRSGLGRRAWPWFAVMAWGFLCAMLSGRRKALLYLGTFVLVFLWRYIGRIRPSQAAAIAAAVIVVAAVINGLSTREESGIYVRGAHSTKREVLQRLEGGALATINQYGFLGGGLGVATQGAYHLLPGGKSLGWQEGGLAKIVVELGVPGALALAFWLFVTTSLLLRLTAIPDVRGSPQLLRVALFAVVVGNVVNFLGSAQAYTDPLLTLMTAFFVGALFATAALDERLSVAEGGEIEVLKAAPRFVTRPTRRPLEQP